MFPQQFSLSGKTILVTGAGSGFGREIAKVCAEAGATVILTSKQETHLKETLQILPAGEHRFIAYNVDDTAGLDAFIEQLPPLDGVVLCAGILRTVPVKFISEDVWQQIIQTNTTAPVLMVQRLLKKRLLQKGCSVVFISSIAAFSAAYGNGIYAASKGALNAFSRVLALELAQLQARSNCVQPGLVRTNISDMNVVTDDDLKNEISKYPLGAGNTSDIANAVLYLLSPASRWVTGTTITIDGGATLV